MKKRIALLIVCCLIFSLAACSANPQSGKAPEAAATVSPAAAPAETSGNPDVAEINYPTGDLTILVPFKSGGFLDVQARTTAQFLAKELGVNVIVQNVDGAGGVLGTTQYLQEKPNTNTILLAGGWVLTVTPLLQDVEYSIDDFVPIIDHNQVDFCLFANPEKSGIHNYEDLVNYGKDKRVLFGSGGPGSSLYIIQKTLLNKMGIESDTITQNGSAGNITDLLAGTVDLAMSDFSNQADNVKSGKLVPILWFGNTTYTDDGTYAAGVPCAKDLGFEITYDNLYFYAIRKGTAQAVIDKLYNAFSAVYANPDFIAARENVNYKPSGKTSEEISEYLKYFVNMAKTSFELK